MGSIADPISSCVITGRCCFSRAARRRSRSARSARDPRAPPRAPRGLDLRRRGVVGDTSGEKAAARSATAGIMFPTVDSDATSGSDRTRRVAAGSIAGSMDRPSSGTGTESARRRRRRAKRAGRGLENPTPRAQVGAAAAVGPSERVWTTSGRRRGRPREHGLADDLGEQEGAGREGPGTAARTRQRRSPQGRRRAAPGACPRGRIGPWAWAHSRGAAARDPCACAGAAPCAARKGTIAASASRAPDRPRARQPASWADVMTYSPTWQGAPRSASSTVALSRPRWSPAAAAGKQAVRTMKVLSDGVRGPLTSGGRHFGAGAIETLRKTATSS